MEGLLKTKVRIGNSKTFYIIELGQWVQITNTEEHLIFGTRYKIMGHHEWFESNCFEEVKK